MKVVMTLLTIFAAAGLTVSIVGLTLHASRLHEATHDALKQPEALAGLEVPAFSLVDQDGTPRTEKILDGQVTVMDFTFTHCPFVCPMMNASMIEELGNLEKTPIKFLSISVDPEHDTPEVLKKHAQELGVDTSRWTFLTGEKAMVDKVLKGSLMFSLQTDESRKIDLPDGSKMDNIVHPARFLLVGPDRKVLGIYDHGREGDMREMEYRAKAAVAAMRGE